MTKIMADVRLGPEQVPADTESPVPDLWTQQQQQHQQRNMKSTVANRPTFEGNGNRSIHDVFGDNYSVVSWDDEEIALRQRLQTPLDEFTPASASGHSGMHVERTDYFAVAEEHGSHLVGQNQGAELGAPEVASPLVQGSVQGFGALVALRKESDGRLIVRVASDNTLLILGYSPEELFAQDRFEDILTGDQTGTFLSYVDLVTDGVYDLRAFGPEVFALSIELTDGSSREVWCAISSSDGYLICEFESQNDKNFPLNVASRKTPIEKTVPGPTMDRPSRRSVANFRTFKGREGQGAASDVLTILSQVQEQLTRALSMSALLDKTAELVKELTDYDQVLVFQLEPDWSAMALAESVGEDVTAQRYKGFQFPGSFMSEQMRSVFTANKVQLLYDRELRSAQLVYRSPEDMSRPLDLRHTYLQGACPLQTQWLARMQVRSTMSIGVNIADKLWGMIICHSYGDRGKRVSFLTRKICVLIGNTLGSNISRLIHQSRLPARRLISAGPTATNPSSWYVVASSNGLLELFQADVGLISIRGETRSFGHQTPSDGCLKLLEHLRDRHIDSVHSSLNIRKDYPDLTHSHQFKSIAGFLFIPLSAGGSDCIIFFRRSQPKLLRTVENPFDDRLGPYEVSAEHAFRTLRIVVQNEAQPWSDADLETAAMLSLVYSRFIEIWRQKESTVHDVQATRLLLANSAHELRTPLNAIINYLEIALEGSLAADVRNYLLESHSLSKSLIYHINDLLDLTKTKGELESMKQAHIDLYTIVKDASSAFTNDAKLKGITYEIQIAADLPRYPRGNQRHIRQAVTNLLSNAFKFTRSGTIRLDCTARLISPGLAEVCISVHDTGVGMSSTVLDALKQCINHVAADDDGSPSNLVADGRLSRGGRDHGSCTLGLGLALVVRILHCYHGNLTVESTERKGSHFQMLFQFSVDEQSTPLPSTGITTPTDDTNVNLVGNKTVLASPPTANGAASQMLVGNNGTIDRQGDTESTAKCDHTNTSASATAPSEARPATPRAKKKPSFADVLKANFQSPRSLQSTKHNHSLNILVAEDDPINRKILQKRLEKVGHRLLITNDGNECVLAYLAQPDAFDVILMDIQMPILDGLKATQLIRSNQTRKTRVPIFAVSASLLETKMDEYISTGFDGWMLKPVDLNSITRLLQGVCDAGARASSTYTPGLWLRGGWFAPQQ